MHFAFFISLGQVIFFISGNTGYIKTFGISYSRFTIRIDHIVGRPLIVLLKDGDMKNIFSDKDLFSCTFTTFMIPRLANTMISSRSEHSQQNSSFFKPVPINPSSRFTYTFVLAIATCLASITSNCLISVFLSLPLPYFFSRFS